VAFVSIAVLSFAPGVGCGQTSSADAARRAKDVAIGRHRFEAVSSYIDTQRKNQRRLEARRAAKAQKQAATSKDPTQLTTFRTGVVIGAWNSYFTKIYPASQVNGGRLTAEDAKLSSLALKAIDTKLSDLTDSAQAAKLDAVASAANGVKDSLPALAADLKDKTLPATDYQSTNRLVKELQAQAKAANLKILARVPTNFVSSN
jgi:hypothetical protein